MIKYQRNEQRRPLEFVGDHSCYMLLPQFRIFPLGPAPMHTNHLILRPFSMASLVAPSCRLFRFLEVSSSIKINVFLIKQKRNKVITTAIQVSVVKRDCSLCHFERVPSSNFYRAVNMAKNEVFYDTMYSIALKEIKEASSRRWELYLQLASYATSS